MHSPRRVEIIDFLCSSHIWIFLKSKYTVCRSKDIFRICPLERRIICITALTGMCRFGPTGQVWYIITSYFIWWGFLELPFKILCHNHMSVMWEYAGLKAFTVLFLFVIYMSKVDWISFRQISFVKDIKILSNSKYQIKLRKIGNFAKNEHSNFKNWWNL